MSLHCNVAVLIIIFTSIHSYIQSWKDVPLAALLLPPFSCTKIPIFLIKRFRIIHWSSVAPACFAVCLHSVHTHVNVACNNPARKVDILHIRTTTYWKVSTFLRRIQIRNGGTLWDFYQLTTTSTSGCKLATKHVCIPWFIYRKHLVVQGLYWILLVLCTIGWVPFFLSSFLNFL